VSGAVPGSVHRTLSPGERRYAQACNLALGSSGRSKITATLVAVSLSAPLGTDMTPILSIHATRTFAEETTRLLTEASCTAAYFDMQCWARRLLALVEVNPAQEVSRSHGFSTKRP
jgi:hypothetical protein